MALVVAFLSFPTSASAIYVCMAGSGSANKTVLNQGIHPAQRQFTRSHNSMDAMQGRYLMTRSRLALSILLAVQAGWSQTATVRKPINNFDISQQVAKDIPSGKPPTVHRFGVVGQNAYFL